MDVVGLLREKQSELGIELDQDLARLLGITHSYLSLLYSGKRQPGGKLLMAMLTLWPDIFSGDGGSGERHSEGDSGDGGADHGGTGDVDAAGAGGDPCTTRTVG